MEKAIRLAVLLLFTISTNAAENLNPDEDPFWQEVPTVITPTRLKQPIRDVPASITVITADMIQNLDIRTIPEALRLVPSMTVTYVAGNKPEVSYHGTNIMAPRRMQVLVDGVSVYRTGKAEMEWSQIPVSIDDIDRIEVVRGPNSASYGINTAVGVINIITNHPEDDWGTRAKLHGEATVSRMHTCAMADRLASITIESASARHPMVVSTKMPRAKTGATLQAANIIGLIFRLQRPFKWLLETCVDHSYIDSCRQNRVAWTVDSSPAQLSGCKQRGYRKLL